MTRKIAKCRVALLKWNNDFQMNAKGKIEKLKREIEEAKESNDQGKKARVQVLKGQLQEAYSEEELYWSQKSRVQWLKEGDKNTHFCHSSVKGKRKRNKLQNLKKIDGTWTNTEEEIGSEVSRYFRNLFESEDVEQSDAILDGIPHTICNHMNDQLTKQVTESEIREALFAMNPTKAPGPDGMTVFSKILENC